MAKRPNFIDIRSHSQGPFSREYMSSTISLPSPALPSPRLNAGQVPPDLSPLDAFAAQSRLLARQLDEGNKSGKRLSRLPPLTIATSLHQNRPGYLRSISAEAIPETDVPTPSLTLLPNSPGSALKTEVEVETPNVRPISVYPQMGRSTPSLPPVPAFDEEQFRGRRPPSSAEGPTFFGGLREHSPAPLMREDNIPISGKPASDVQSRPSMESLSRPSYSSEVRPRPSLDSLPRPSYSSSEGQSRPSLDSIRQRGIRSRRPQDVNLAISNFDPRGLAPPRSPFSQRTPSPRSMSESSEDDFSFSNMAPPRRKLSNGSGISPAPMSPVISIPRSPSISSEISVGGTRLPRPAFNFSRPLSRASANGVNVDYPVRQASSDSQPSFILADETADTPVSMHSEAFLNEANETGPAPSYIYSKFSLPRGKTLQRNSLIFQDSTALAQYSWEQPVTSSNVHTLESSSPPSPPTRPSTSSNIHDNLRPAFEPARHSFDRPRPSNERSGLSSFESHTDRPSSASAASSSTIKARSQHSLAPTAEMDAEQHVAKAIEYHESGAVLKSTYHLRLAARQNHPTGMLLYALACRHGWGMRPNQKEGVAWLRKAADFAILDVADDEELDKVGKSVDVLEKKTRKAQFALSIYELGVSHMNGWGIEQDKALALRCFEIAGSWGDPDALAEAGFCYAQGIGCKKDLKKSAKFYRQAESKGISMIGNSWIYKSKYNEDDASSKKSMERGRGAGTSPEKAKKERNKSRTRTIFGRSKTST